MEKVENNGTGCDKEPDNSQSKLIQVIRLELW